MSENIRQLAAARLAAIERGDKALGREIYHQLLNLGVPPHQVDAMAASHFANAPQGQHVEVAVSGPGVRQRKKRAKPSPAEAPAEASGLRTPDEVRADEAAQGGETSDEVDSSAGGEASDEGDQAEGPSDGE